MAVEIQIRVKALSRVLTSMLEVKLRSLCVSLPAGVYLDHVDAIDELEPQQAGDGVTARMPIDVFTTTLTDLKNAPNKVPALTQTRVYAVYNFTLAGAELSVKAIGISPNPGVPMPELPSITHSFKDVLAAFKVKADAPQAIQVAGDVLALRFDTSHPLASHLHPGQDWGVFVDPETLNSLLLSDLDFKQLPDGVGTPQITPTWSPQGTAPHLDVGITVPVRTKIPLLVFDMPVSGHVEVPLSVDLVLLGTPAGRTLQAQFAWGVHAHLDGIAEIGESCVEDKVAQYFDPKRFGAVPTGDRTFTRDLQHLTPERLGSATLQFDTLLADKAGLTLGGVVTISRADEPSRSVLQANTVAFTPPIRLTVCSILARTGSGDPPVRITAGSVRTTAWCDLHRLGQWCGYEIVGPSAQVAKFTHVNVEPSSDSATIRVSFQGDSARGVGGPVQLIVKTARGVRFIDFGTPKLLEFDSEGYVTNAVANHIDNCRYRIPLASQSGGPTLLGVIKQAMLDPIWDPDYQYVTRAIDGSVTRYRFERARLVGSVLGVESLVAKLKELSHTADINVVSFNRNEVDVALPEGLSVRRPRG